MSETLTGGITLKKDAASGAELAQYKMVRMSGLPLRFNRPGCIALSAGTLQAPPDEFGRWDHRNGFLIAVTPTGEVWIGDAKEVMGCLDSLGAIDRLCKNGKGVHLQAW